MAKAYENNPNLAAARAGLRATDEGVPLAKSVYRPQVSGEIGLDVTNSEVRGPAGGRSRVTDGTASASVSVNQTLFDGFQGVNNIRSAEAEVRSGRQSLRGTESDVLLAAAQAYANIIRDQAVVAIRQRNIAFLREQQNASQARFDVGEATRTDVSQAEAELAGAGAALQSAVAQLRASEAVYVQIVGAVPSGLAGPAVPAKLLPRSADQAVAVGLREHPAILEQLSRVDSAGYQVKAAEGALLPGVSISGTVSETDGGISTTRLGARVTVPIYQGGAATARIRQRKELLGQQRLSVDVTRDQVRQEAVSAWTQLQAATANIAAIQRQIEAAQLALNGVIEERTVGQRTTLDVLQQQQQVLQARESLAQAQRNRVVASYLLLDAIGRLSVKQLGLAVANYRPQEHYEAVKDKWYGLRTPDGR